MVGSKNYSFSVRDDKLVSAIEEYKKSGGNLSGLISNLLYHYFFGNSSKEVISKEMLFLFDIKAKLDEFMQWREEILPKLHELEAKLKEKQEIKETEDNLHLIRELREVVFEDLQDFNSFKSRCLKFGREPDDAIKVRLNSWASDKNISNPVAVQLFYKAFPELKEKVSL